MFYENLVHTKNIKIYIFLFISILFHIFIFAVLPNRSSIANSENINELIVKMQPVTNKIYAPKIVLQHKNQVTQNTKPLIKNRVLKTENTEDESARLPYNEPKYYLFQELDSKPVVLKDIDTNSSQLSNHPEGGNLTLQLWLDETGSVIRVKVLETDLPVEFSNDATLNFLKLKFSPGLKNNQYVKSTVKITVKYQTLTNN